MKAVDLPLMAYQAAHVMLTAERLPEPEGPRTGHVGSGKPLRKILIVGDSSAAGVGTPSQDQALAGRLATHLATRFDVDWTLVARSGATTRWLLPALHETELDAFDIAILSIGVNDAKNGMPLWLFERTYQGILEHLTDTMGIPDVIASGLAPVKMFPLLPEPLRSVVGARVEQFDAHIRRMSAECDGARYQPIEVEPDMTAMARDGFHPGPKIYDEWAALLARKIH